MNTSEVTIGSLLDFSKAFDTTDNLTLLQKLYKMSFSMKALKLIQRYISEQLQYVQIDDKTSSNQLNNFGVPQGSILGLVLIQCRHNRTTSAVILYNTQIILCYTNITS